MLGTLSLLHSYIATVIAVVIATVCMAADR